MNLRTHTYLIPTLCGLGAFAVLVTSDFSVRRMVNGHGYGLSAYLGEALPVEGAPIRALSMARPTPTPLPVDVGAASMVDEVFLAEPEPEPMAMPELVADALPVAPAAGAAATPVIDAPQVEAIAEAPPETPPEAMAETAPEPAPEPAQEPSSMRLASDPSIFAAKCSSDKGFKRCRVGE